MTLSRVSSTDTVLSYTVSGTATPGAGNDYTPLSGTVTIAAGATTADIDVAVLDDDLVEGPETVIVTLSAVSSGDPEIAIDDVDHSATLSISDDDTATVSIAKLADGAEAGPANGKFRVSQTQASSTDTVRQLHGDRNGDAGRRRGLYAAERDRDHRRRNAHGGHRRRRAERRAGGEHRNRDRDADHRHQRRARHHDQQRQRDGFAGHPGRRRGHGVDSAGSKTEPRRPRRPTAASA